MALNVALNVALFLYVGVRVGVNVGVNMGVNVSANEGVNEGWTRGRTREGWTVNMEHAWGVNKGYGVNMYTCVRANMLTCAYMCAYAYAYVCCIHACGTLLLIEASLIWSPLVWICQFLSKSLADTVDATGKCAQIASFAQASYRVEVSHEKPRKDAVWDDTTSILLHVDLCRGHPLPQTIEGDK